MTLSCLPAQTIYGRRQSLVPAEGDSPEDVQDIVSAQQFAAIVLAPDSGCPAFAALHSHALPAEAA